MDAASLKYLGKGASQYSKTAAPLQGPDRGCAEAKQRRDCRREVKACALQIVAGALDRAQPRHRPDQRRRGTDLVGGADNVRCKAKRLRSPTALRLSPLDRRIGACVAGA